MMLMVLMVLMVYRYLHHPSPITHHPSSITHHPYPSSLYSYLNLYSNVNILHKGVIYPTLTYEPI